MEALSYVRFIVETSRGETLKVPIDAKPGDYSKLSTKDLPDYTPLRLTLREAESTEFKEAVATLEQRQLPPGKKDHGHRLVGSEYQLEVFPYLGKIKISC